jgi:hypothetical protein
MPPRRDDRSPGEVLTAWDRLPRAGAGRTGTPDAGRPGTGAPLPLAAAVAAGWASVVGLAPLVVLSAIGAIGTGTATGGVFRIAAGAWLLGHGVPLVTPTDRITLVPLGITAWVAWRLARAGVHAGRAAGAHRVTSAWPAVRAGLAVAVAYAVVGTVAATVARTVDVGVSPPRAAVSFGVLAGVMAVGGALGRGRSRRRLMRRIPPVVAGAVRSGLAAVAFLLAAGAAAAGLALALSGGDATEMLGAFRAGVSAQVGITALCLVYLPNLAVWGASYLVGPGFAVGTGTVVSPGDVLLGPVPALPVFAGLPSEPLAGAGMALLGVPLVAGLAAGALLPRASGAPALRWPPLLGAALLAGPVAGVLVHLVTLASRGGLGSGRLADLGPADARVALLAGGVIGVGTLIGAVSRRSLTRSDG